MSARVNNNSSKNLSIVSGDHASKGTNEESCENQRQCGGVCGLLQKYTITSILIFMVLGLVTGIGLSYWHPEDEQSKDTAIQWIGVLGDVFLWLLKAFVLPLVFVNIIISVVDMMNVGKAKAIGWTVIALYLITTVAAALFGTISSLIFSNFYKTDESMVSNEPDMEEVSISDTIYSGIVEKIVPKNLIMAFGNNEFTQVIFLGMVLGVALVPELRKNGKAKYFVGLLMELNTVLQRILRWILMLTPFAILSLMASRIGNVNDLGATFSNIGMLMGAALVAWGMQILFIYFGLFALLTKSNPFLYMKHIVPAQLFAFSTASSAATIPQSIEACVSSGKVSNIIARFVVPFGATVNMDGGAVYFVVACVWLAVLNGQSVTAADYIMLIVIATMGSIGTAPVPFASQALILTAYNSVFGGTGVPNGFSYILAIDWFMDRCRTLCNVTGDCIVTGIVAHRNPITDDDCCLSESTRDGDLSLSSNEESEEYMMKDDKKSVRLYSENATSDHSV